MVIPNVFSADNGAFNNFYSFPLKAKHRDEEKFLIK